MLRQNPADTDPTATPEPAPDREPTDVRHSGSAPDVSGVSTDGAHSHVDADAEVSSGAAHSRMATDGAYVRVTDASVAEVSPEGAPHHGNFSQPGQGAPAAEDALGVFTQADLPWYGLDAGWQGARALGSVSTGPDGMVEFGTLRHGDPPATRPDARAQRRSVTVLTMARLGRRPLFKPDGQPAGSVEAMTVGAAAALAGVGLVEDNWPWDLDPSVRQQWLDQQREMAYEVSEVLAGDPWQPLTLLVGHQQQPFHYRESPYGWVLASARPDCFLAAYGRGVSAYSLAFVRVDPKLYG